MATGRHAPSLGEVTGLGADAVIDLTAPDDRLLAAFREEMARGVDVILDFLWGRPTEKVVQALVPTGLGLPGRNVHLIQIGQSAGPSISLPAEALRTSGLRIVGGAENISPEA